MVLVRTTAAALAALTLAVATPAFAQGGPPAGTTIVYLNSQAVLQAAPGAAEAQRTFERELTEWRTELNTEATALDSLVRDYQRQEVMLSPQAKEQRQTDLRTRQQQLQTKGQELDNRARQRQSELLQPIVERVTSVIEQVRSERNYSVVLDASSEAIVTADTSLDITDLVIQRLGGQPAAGGTP